MTITDRLDEAGIPEEMYTGAVIIDGFDQAAIGCSDDGRLVYDYDRMIGVLMADGCTETEAMEYIDYNILGAYKATGSQYPIITYRI